MSHLTNTSIVFSASSVRVALNLGDDAVSLPVPGASSVEVGAGTLDGSDVRLKPHGWAVLT